MIPEEILKVNRPKNTIVYAYGKNKDKYAVKERIGCKYIGGRRLPVTGGTIGHIVDGVYVPIDVNSIEDVRFSDADLRDYADIVLCDFLFKDILDELLLVYSKHDALTIYCISLLRVANKGIKDYELKEAYDTSFLSILYPDVALSKNTVSDFLYDLGKACSRIETFMRNRTKNVSIDHHLLIDGTLKSNESRINSLSDFSRKARTKGTRDISVLFAFDLEKQEPICSKCFPGNMLDSISYESFIKDNGIKKGIIVADKGFPSSCAAKEFENNKELFYLNPIKRNAKVIETYKLCEYEGILENKENILYKKVKCKNTNKWLYSFYDNQRASKEECDYLRNAKRKDTYSYENLIDKKESFGTIVLESNYDMPVEVAYKTFDKRWEIEIVMRFYKSALEFDETRVHKDYSVIASEFCDFLSTVLTFRLINKFDELNLLDVYTYKKLMSILKRAKKIKTKDDWKLIKTAPSSIEILKKLSIIKDDNTKPKRKRGRPKTSV